MALPSTIAHLKPYLRPRERLREQGAANLSNTELLAIILGSGTKKQNVFQVSRNVLKKTSLSSLGGLSFQDLCAIPGLGSAKAAQILASLELGNRAHHVPLTSFLSPHVVWQETQEIHYKQREYLWALYLDARHQLVSKHLLAVGSLNQTIIEARDVFMEAIKKPSAGVILVHNHPSGDTQPSDADVSFTQVIAAAGELLGITLLDHVIVSSKGYYSFREKKLL